MRFTLPSEKVQKLLTLCQQIRSSSKVLLQTLAQLLGLLESYRLAVWQAPLHFRYLQALLNPHQRSGPNESQLRGSNFVMLSVPRGNQLVATESRNSQWQPDYNTIFRSDYSQTPP